ncbi:MAG: hypothetical protein UU87_C0001G0068 [Parcubacteria group bacterium GW2011_GWA2_42_11]|nr:MAG: hypothetical protein UU87_C0001G0068 [Parcubacteria group bacterium GW2011_GWA2_42_11]
MIEMVIYVGLSSILVLVIAFFASWLIQAGTKAKLSRALTDNGRQAMDTIIFEIKKSQSIYEPASVFDDNFGQLSLVQATSSIPGEIQTYVDIFQCGAAICLKREGAEPISLTNGQVRVSDFVFRRLLNVTDTPSIQISLRLENSFSSARPEYQDFLDLTTTVNLRNY